MFPPYHLKSHGSPDPNLHGHLPIPVSVPGPIPQVAHHVIINDDNVAGSGHRVEGDILAVVLDEWGQGLVRQGVPVMVHRYDDDSVLDCVLGVAVVGPDSEVEGGVKAVVGGEVVAGDGGGVDGERRRLHAVC